MDSLEDIIAAQHAAREPHDDPLVEKLLAELLLVAEELCVARDRLATCRELAAQGKPVDDEAIDTYELNEAEIETRLKAHRAMFEELFERLSRT